jgi:hypothetical protein
MTIPPLRETAGVPVAHQRWDDWLSKLGDGPHGTSGRPLVASRRLPPEVDSPKIARHVTRNALSAWSLTRFYDDAAIVVSELVTNAIRHGMRQGAEEVLRLVLVRCRSDLVCMVTDPADDAPTMREPDYVNESGRGLHIIEAMSRAWGWTPLLGGGKAVWAAFSII